MRRLASLAVLIVCFAATACAPRLQHPGIEPQHPDLQIETEQPGFVMDDGVRLPARIWRPEGEVKAVMLALHGFNLYSRIFEEPAEKWAERGILTITYDQRGFGDTPERGIWPGTGRMIRDLEIAAGLVRRQYPDVPLVLLGDSMGGAVVLAANASSDPPDADGLVLVAPAVWGREAMPFYQTAGLWFFAHTLPWLEVTGQHLNRAPTDNIDLLRQLGRDPLVIFRTRIDVLWGLVNLMDAGRAAVPAIDRPTLVLYGAKEDILPEQAWRDAFKALPKDKDTTLTVYSGGFHMLLHDLEADAVIDDITAFTLTRKAPARE
ncbi:MAG: alpha/beta hydrolase [Alphaproteobacteria bacterium]